MSFNPSVSCFSLDECLKLGGSVGDYPLHSENEFSFDSDITVCKDNYEESVNLFQEDSPELFQDNFLSSNLFNLSEKSSFSSDSHFNFDENILPFEEPSENSSPTSFVKSIVDWSICENYIEPETDLQSFSKELYHLNTSELSEQLNTEYSEKIFNDITESANCIKDEKVATTEYPVTVILKKIKDTPNNNPNMVAPLNIPKTTYTLVRVPGKNTNTNIPKRVSVFNINPNTLPSNKNETYSALKSQKDLNINRISPVFINEKPIEIKKEKVTQLSRESNGSSEVLNYNELPFTSLKRKYPNLSKPKPQKKKAYELSPLPDPTLERCRRNAINAKKNRDIKKQKMMELEAEVEQERQEKLILASENETLKQMNEELQKKIDMLLTSFGNSEPILEDTKFFRKSKNFLDESNASSEMHQQKIFTPN